MPGAASLARLFRDYAERWEFRAVERGTEWVAVLRGSEPVICIIGARDLGALRYRMEEAERRGSRRSPRPSVSYLVTRAAS
jgi:hypothetical protein